MTQYVAFREEKSTPTKCIIDFQREKTEVGWNLPVFISAVISWHGVVIAVIDVMAGKGILERENRILNIHVGKI